MESYEVNNKAARAYHLFDGDVFTIGSKTYEFDGETKMLKELKEDYYIEDGEIYKYYMKTGNVVSPESATELFYKEEEELKNEES